MYIPNVLLEGLPDEVQKALRGDPIFPKDIEKDLDYFFDNGGKEDELSPPFKTTGFDNLDTYQLDPDLDLPELFILKKEDSRDFIYDILRRDENLGAIVKNDIYENYFSLDKLIQDFGYDLGINKKSDVYNGSVAPLFLPELFDNSVEMIESDNYIIFYKVF